MDLAPHPDLIRKARRHTKKRKFSGAAPVSELTLGHIRMGAGETGVDASMASLPKEADMSVGQFHPCRLGRACCTATPGSGSKQQN